MSEPRIIVIDQTGQRHEIPAPPGFRVMEIIRDSGLPIRAECGGCCACATCHVYVSDGWNEKLPAKDEEEEDMLDLAFDVADTSRLSCQLLMTPELDGLTVTLAPGTE
jgi:2Fe-2S ferredoxin